MVVHTPKTPDETNRWYRACYYVESNCLPFFDFYRDWAFGYIEVEPGRGFYARIRYTSAKILEAFCSCADGRRRRICAHVFALHQRVMNWPKETLDLSRQFDDWYLTCFFKEHGEWIKRDQPHLEPHAFCDPSQVNLSPRMLTYWGFSDSRGTQTKHDLEQRARVIRDSRSTTEKEMARRGLKSKRIQFEESPWYSLAKIFFFASLEDALITSVTAGPSNTAMVQLAIRNSPTFSSHIPVDVFLHIFRQHADDWSSKMDFKVLIRALPIIYQIRFSPSGDLQIHPGIDLSDAHFEPIEALAIPQAKNLYFHESLGYFQTQIGLTPFELTYSRGSGHVIEAQTVASFLREHAQTLDALDRRFMDPVLFEELVVEKIDRLEITLIDFSDHLFEAEILAHAGQAAFDQHALGKIASSPKRFIKLAGRLIDTRSPDWDILATSLHRLDGVAILETKILFRLIGYFSQKLEIRTNQKTGTTFDALVKKRAKNPPDLSHTQLELRPYQNQGYEWLYFLLTFRLGGLLCDQMGLGKTHQAMALMGALFKNAPRSRVLVICPATVIYHWENLLKKFGPFTTHLYHGLDKQDDQLNKTGVITITTYPTLRNDLSILNRMPYDLIVFDEIQMAKNPATKIHKALAQLTGSVKIGLTGTPIENQLSDLKALMDLVLPGYLGDAKSFRHNFEIPIIHFKSRAARKKFRETIGPFTLRRSKKDVLPDLPPVTQTRHTFSMSAYETTLYEKIKSEGKKTDQKEGSSSRYFHIFNVIDRLKRICNHPALFFNRVDYAAFPATKWELFTQILDESLSSGDKVVVFTQYLGMIALFQQYLKNHQIPYACITGKTQDRKGQIQNFQDDDNCRVFLGTIRASGLGIDLHAGRVLIHYDRWWNPAREEQVTSRVHRMGQKKGVQVFHLMGINTIEERIDEIIQAKRDLLDKVVQFDATSLSKILSLEELLQILD